MVGKTLSHYKIIAELGRGGMGIVYRAADTKLDRTVAIKVLPSATLASADDRARFYREAKAAAQLHHPHIASVFEIDEAVPSDAPHDAQPSPFIAMEFVDGESLAGRVASGPLKIDESVRLAKEIASALEAAHEKNIVHRDIKSANVMVTSKGRAKVLDFGLAKTTHSTLLTRMGSTLGTYAYMSPEQARGEEVDRRTDIWALGVVLYEMVSGRHPFPGDYEQAVVYSILNQDPEPLTAVRTGVPMELERIVNKMLAKDPARRYQTIADATADLLGVDVTSGAGSMLNRGPRSAVSSNTTATVPEAPPAVTGTVAGGWLTPARTALAMLLVLIAGLAIGKWILGGSGESTENPVVRRISMRLEGLSDVEAPGISPDGRFLVFTAYDSTRLWKIFIYDFEKGDFAASYPNRGFRYSKFSPDGRWLAMSGIGEGISTILLPDGNPQVVSTRGEWGVWESNESLLMRLNSDLYRISATGGEPELVARPDSSIGLNRLWPMDVLIDQQKALIAGAGSDEFDRRILSLDLTSGEYEQVIDKAHAASYLDSGHLMYLQGGGLVGQLVVRAFDKEKVQPYGLPATLGVEQLNWLSWAVGEDGTVVYAAERVVGENKYTWIQADGTMIGDLPIGGRGTGASISNGGGRIAATDRVSSDFFADVYIYDLENNRAPVRIPSDGDASPPVWSPDDTRIYFSDNGQSGTVSTILSTASDGSGAPDVIVELENTDIRWMSLHPDGIRFILYDGLSRDLYQLTLTDTTYTRLTHTPDLEELGPVVSPDGKYVAYHDKDVPGSRIVIIALESGGRWEIFDPRSTFRNPKWSPDGRSLYFSNSNGDIFSHRVALDPTFTLVGVPEKIATFSSAIPEVAVHPDGRRLLISAPDVELNSDDQLNLILNFKEEAKRIAPVR